MLSRFCLSMQRLLLSAWVGAAGLFVITSVAEQQFPGFESAIKNQLATIRFPKYYAMGFMVVLTSLGCSVVCWLSGARSKADRVVVGLLVLASVTMLVDFVFIYQPLHTMMADLQRPRDTEFQWYHQASKYINSVAILLTLVAAILVCRSAEGAPLPTTPSQAKS